MVFCVCFLFQDIYTLCYMKINVLNINIPVDMNEFLRYPFCVNDYTVFTI